MKSIIFISVITTVALLFYTPHLQAEIKHKSDFKLRSRAALLNIGEEEGQAVSFRLRWTHQTQINDTLKSLIEVDGVAEFFENKHSNGVHFNGKPTIPDVEGIDLNQIALFFSKNRTQATIGRQRLSIGNERFIGGAGFWQNEQTFDALKVKTKTLQSSSFTYTYINKVNRIFGRKAGDYLIEKDLNYTITNGARPKTKLGAHTHDTHLFQFNMEEWDYAKLSFFHYRIENKTAQAVSNSTTGLSYKVNYKHHKQRYLLQANHARQELTKEGADGLNYTNLQLGWGVAGVTFFAEYEALEGNGEESFTTPLASLHDHQGWTDKFLVTPIDGISDTSFRMLWRLSPFRIDLRLHNFSEGSGSTEYGKELDFNVTYAVNRKHKLMLHYAHFKAHPDFPLGLTSLKNAYLTYTIKL